MPQKAAQTVEIQAVLQLLVSEGVTASVRRHADIGIDAYRVGSFPHKNANSLIGQFLPCLAEKHQFFIAVTPHEILFACAQILIQKLADSWILWDNPLFPSFAVDHKIGVLYLIQLHVGQLTQPDPRIKENHKDHAIAYTDIVAAIEVFQHQRDFLCAEGMNQHLRLLHIPDSFGQDLFAVTFLLGIGAQAFDGFQQIVDICWLASSVLQGADILFDMGWFQLFELNYLKVFSNKMAEFIELFFVIVDCKFREFTNLTIK